MPSQLMLMTLAAFRGLGKAFAADAHDARRLSGLGNPFAAHELEEFRQGTHACACRPT